MVLGKGQTGCVELARLQPLIDVAGEGEGRLHPVGRVGVEGLEPFAVQARQIVGNAHQPAQLGHRAAARRPGQGGGVLKKAPLRGGQDGIGFSEIQPLGRGQDDQQDRAPAALPSR